MSGFYNFIEIGTADFNTCLQDTLKHHLYQTGISIEPIQYKLDNLPNDPLIQKICAAMVISSDLDLFKEVYYIPDNVINSRNLPWYLKGCSQIGQVHPTLLKEVPDCLNYIQSSNVRTLNWLSLTKEFNIKDVDLLKIDIEGGDAALLLDLFSLYDNNKIIWLPSLIKAEIFNGLTPQSDVDNLLHYIREKQWLHRIINEDILIYPHV